MENTSPHTLRASQPYPAVSRFFSAEESADRLSPDALARHRADALRAVVRRAYDGSKLYRTKLDGAGVSPDDIAGPADLAKLPFLTKDELRGDPWALLACDRRRVALIQVSTGTTGGEEIYMPYTLDDYLVHDLAPRYSNLFPVVPGDVCLNALPYEMSTAGLAFHKTFMDGYQATVVPAGKGGAYSTAAKTVKIMKDLRPNIAVTSPSWAVTVAEEAENAGLSLPGLQMKKMWLTGEGCSPALRGRIEKLWGTTANFFYGSLECGVLGIECDAHDGYHLAEAHVVLEIIDPRSGKPLADGETGELVVTSLLRHDSPVLRFRTGDMGFLAPTPCTCGASLARFHLRGRAVDQLRVHGKSLSPLFVEELLMRIPEIGNWYQIVVPTSGASPHLGIRCEAARGVTPSNSLIAALGARLSAAAGVPIEIDLVDRIPRHAGKAVRIVHE